MFYDELIIKLFKSLGNYHAGNYDELRFGPKRQSLVSRLAGKIRQWLAFHKLYHFDLEDRPFYSLVRTYGPYMQRLAGVYELLEDDESRSLLVDIIAYRIMGPRHVKLPVNTREYWKQRSMCESLRSSADTVHVKTNNWALWLYDLKSLGYDMRVYARSPMTLFVLDQYAYHGAIDIAPSQDDVVLDCGGAWGDTALWFASKAGPNGRVYSFECMDENLAVFRKNMTLNPAYSANIEIVPEVLWSISGEKLEMVPHGPGSRVAPGRLTHKESSVIPFMSTSIDDFVDRRGLDRLDLIKMDIEGSELHALRGAEKAIRRFCPKLAISVYHRVSDLVEIPEYLRSLDLGYRFFLKHLTIHNEETVLFAAAL